MNRIGKALLAGTAALVVTGGAGMTGAAAHTGCPSGWGSLPERATAAAPGTVQDVRSGRHTCYDRLVVDLAGRAAGSYDVRYVAQVHEDGSGRAVPLRGAGDVRIIVQAPAYDDAGRATYRPANRRELVSTAGYQTFRQVAYAGSFEGQTTIGLGVRARLPFRVMVLPGPGTGSRLVVDVAHHW